MNSQSENQVRKLPIQKVKMPPAKFLCEDGSEVEVERYEIKQRFTSGELCCFQSIECYFDSDKSEISFLMNDYDDLYSEIGKMSIPRNCDPRHFILTCKAWTQAYISGSIFEDDYTEEE